MIMRSKIFNSKAYQVFDYICRLIILNILLIICSFSIFLIAAAIFEDLKEIYIWLLLVPFDKNFLDLMMVNVFSCVWTANIKL